MQWLRTIALPLALASIFGCAEGANDDGVGDPSPDDDDGGTQMGPDDSGVTTTTPTHDSSLPPSTDASAGADAALSGDAAPGQDGGDGGAEGGTTGPSAACVAALAGDQFDFENGAAGWTHEPMDGFAGDSEWPFDAWAVGTATNPPACHGGTKCWATNLTGNYIQCARASLQSPSIDLSACAAATDVKLVFQHAFAFWTGVYGGTTRYDGGLVEISNDGGNTWTAVPGITYPGTIAINPNRGSNYSCLSGNAFYVSNKPGFVGTSGGWQKVEVSIPVAYRTTGFAVRFAYAAGVSSSTSSATGSESSTAAGWHIDDVGIEAQ